VVPERSVERSQLLLGGGEGGRVGGWCAAKEDEGEREMVQATHNAVRRTGEGKKPYTWQIFSVAFVLESNLLKTKQTKETKSHC
jgi:hypothetical protein